MLLVAGLAGCTPTKEGPSSAKKQDGNGADAKKKQQAKDESQEKPSQKKAPAEGEPAKKQTPAKEQPSKGETSKQAPTAEAKVSTFAPAEDLENQLSDYLKDMQASVVSEQEYKDLPEGKIARDANTVIVIALTLGMSDQENKYKACAGALMKAAAELAATKDYASAKKAVEAVVAAAGSAGGGDQLKWEKVAALDQLMKQVPLIHTKLKMKTEGARFKSKAKDTAGYSAVIAAIGQASIADTTQAKNEEEIQKWRTLCTDMRDTAGAINAAIHKQDRDAANAAMTRLQQNCDDCHKVFHPAALGKTGE